MPEPVDLSDVVQRDAVLGEKAAVHDQHARLERHAAAAIAVGGGGGGGRGDAAQRVAEGQRVEELAEHGDDGDGQLGLDLGGVGEDGGRVGRGGVGAGRGARGSLKMLRLLFFVRASVFCFFFTLDQ